MSNSLCRGGLPRQPAVKNCLSGCQCARVVGASRSCRSRRYTLLPLLSVTPLSSPGPHAQHPTSHRVSELVGEYDFGCVYKFCVGADRRVRPDVSIRCCVTAYGCIPFGFARYLHPASTKAPFRTSFTQPCAAIGRCCFRPPANTALRLMRWFCIWKFRVGEGRRALPHVSIRCCDTG